jgi:hypothetical protein
LAEANTLFLAPGGAHSAFFRIFAAYRQNVQRYKAIQSSFFWKISLVLAEAPPPNSAKIENIAGNVLVV